MRKFLVLALVPMFFAVTACQKSEETPAAPEASAAASEEASPAASAAAPEASPAASMAAPETSPAASPAAS